MPLLLVVAVIVLVWMILTYKARQRLKDCRWRENHAKDTPEGRYFICMNCGAETFAANNLPPPVCLRKARRTSRP
ncbi:hypothetical protein [Fluviibacterium sp. S390]|uniref:hypothetical protein n=1 Tax=Fluviibacterium sp. S390 TaxID=3415139 RepID=UPI003C7EBD0C